MAEFTGKKKVGWKANVGIEKPFVDPSVQGSFKATFKKGLPYVSISFPIVRRETHKIMTATTANPPF